MWVSQPLHVTSVLCGTLVSFCHSLPLSLPSSFSPWCYPLGIRSSATGTVLYPTIPFSITGQYRLKRSIPPPHTHKHKSAQALSQQCFHRLMLCPKNPRCRKDSRGASASHRNGRSTKRSLLSMTDFPGDFLRLTRRRKRRPGDNRDFWKKVWALALNQSGLHSQFCLLLAAWPWSRNRSIPLSLSLSARGGNRNSSFGYERDTQLMKSLQKWVMS